MPQSEKKSAVAAVVVTYNRLDLLAVGDRKGYLAQRSGAAARKITANAQAGSYLEGLFRGLPLPARG